VAARTSTSRTLVVSDAHPEVEETSPPQHNVEHPTPPASPRASSPKRARIEPVEEPTQLSGGFTTSSLNDVSLIQYSFVCCFFSHVATEFFSHYILTFLSFGFCSLWWRSFSVSVPNSSGTVIFRTSSKVLSCYFSLDWMFFIINFVMTIVTVDCFSSRPCGSQQTCWRPCS
jgi:hypothetical protein